MNLSITKTSIFVILFSFLGVMSCKSKKDVYDVVEAQPEYPGGIQEMYKFLGQNIHYPEICREAGISGKVYVQFIINKKGKIESVECIRSPHESLAKEAERVIKLMPRWKPGRQKGKKVNVRYTLPINFTLE